MATILWAHVHGLACLLLDGPLAMQFESESQRVKYLRSIGEKFADMVLQKATK
jgi:hypothetical protein